MPRGPLPAVALTVLLAGACSQPRDPIVLHGTTIIVENQTVHEWRTVIVTVNDHFRGGVASLAAGGILTAPLTQFQTAHGQRFELARQTVVKVDVTATDSNGTRVTLHWGDAKR